MTRRVSLGRLYLDLIRDGADVDGRSGREYDRCVYRALVRSAMSAAQCGQQLDEWMVLVCESISVLGQQAKRRGGRADRSDCERDRLLLDAWTTAERRIAERPTMTAQDRRDHIAAVRTFCDDADAKITNSERATLAAACDLADKWNTTRPALPWRKVAELSGLGERATKNALASLRHKGLLVLHRRGTAADDQHAGRRRANVYHLPDPSALAALGGVPYTPRKQTYGTRPTDLVNATHDATPEEQVITVTVSGPDAEALTARLAELLAATGVQVGERPQITVLPGGRQDTAADDRPKPSRRATP